MFTHKLFECFMLVNKRGIFVIRDWVFSFSVNRERSHSFLVICELSITVIRDWHIVSSVNCEMSVIFSVNRE